MFYWILYLLLRIPLILLLSFGTIVSIHIFSFSSVVDSLMKLNISPEKNNRQTKSSTKDQEHEKMLQDQIYNHESSS